MLQRKLLEQTDQVKLADTVCNLQTEMRELRAELAECQKECEEQARLLGMSGSREAKLLAELEVFRRT